MLQAPRSLLQLLSPSPAGLGRTKGTCYSWLNTVSRDPAQMDQMRHWPENLHFYHALLVPYPHPPSVARPPSMDAVWEPREKRDLLLLHGSLRGRGWFFYLPKCGCLVSVALCGFISKISTSSRLCSKNFLFGRLETRLGFSLGRMF